MNFILYFYLAHFLSDYPFQSTTLVNYKQKSGWGVLIHTLIHLLSMLVLLSPFLDNKKVWVAIGIIYVTHNLIDQTKVQLIKKSLKHIKLFYFLDQLIHWTIIFLAAHYVGQLTPHFLTGAALKLFTSQILSLYLLILVLSTYFYDVTRYFVLLKKKSKAFKRDYRTMLRNAVIVTAGFGVYIMAY